MLVDANLLLFSVDTRSPVHERARAWLEQQLRGVTRVGLPWPVLGAFVRIATNPRASDRPLTPVDAWRRVDEWLASENAWIPNPTPRHAQILGNLITTYELRGNLISDAQLAALAVEHGLTVYSADTDFARFTEIRWVNPLVGAE